MNGPLRASRMRMATGGILLLLAASALVFVLPDASERKIRQQQASEAAMKELAAQQERLAALRTMDEGLARNRKRVADLLGGMPDESPGQLQWKLSRRLYQLAQQNGVSLQSLKYGSPTREGAKGTDLEVLDVEFTAVGVYQNLKPFMLGLEDTRQSALPFAVMGAKLEESPEGARLSVTLRAFRRASRQEAP
jgi:hypothetical protein